MFTVFGSDFRKHPKSPEYGKTFSSHVVGDNA